MAIRCVWPYARVAYGHTQTYFLPYAVKISDKIAYGHICSILAYGHTRFLRMAIRKNAYGHMYAVRMAICTPRMAIRRSAYGHTLSYIWPYAILHVATCTCHVWPYAERHMAIRYCTYGHTLFFIWQPVLCHIWPYSDQRMAIRYRTYGHTLFYM